MELSPLQAPVVICKTCGCEEYETRSSEDSACGRCGCPAISHSILRSAIDDTGVSLGFPSLMPTGESQASAAGKTKKRPLVDPLNERADPLSKKAKLSSFQTEGPQQSGMFRPRACKVLERGHVHFSEIEDIPTSSRGVYKVAYEYKTIYVGSNSCMLRSTLRGLFNGNGNRDLYDFINSLTPKDLEKLSVYWLDESKFVHNCGKKSYLKCIEESEKRKPKFNSALSKKTPNSWCKLM